MGLGRRAGDGRLGDHQPVAARPRGRGHLAGRRELPGDGTWARAFRLYLWLAAVTVVVRVLFRVLLGGVDGGHVWLLLPEVSLPEWTAGIRLLGSAHP